MADKKKRVSQTGSILEYMKRGNPLDGNKAIQMFGCHRLPARISDFEKRGYVFSRQTLYGKTRYGTQSHWTEYKLIGELNEDNKSQISV